MKIPPDSVKFSYFYNSSIELRRSNPDSALELARKALAFAKEIDSLKTAKCYRNIGIIYKNKAQYKNAIQYYSWAWNIYQSQNLEENQAIIYNDLGNVYKYQGDYSKSFEYYLKSTAIRERLGLESSLAGSYMNIGNFLNQQGNFKRAREYYEKSIAMCISIGDSIRLGRALMNSGINEISLKDYSKAEELLTNSETVSLKTDRRRLPILHLNFGHLYQQQLDFERALFEFNQAKKMYEDFSDLYGKCNAEINAGWAYFSLMRYPEALINANSSISWSRSVNAKELEIRSLRLAADAMEKIGLFEKSIEVFRKYHHLHDSLYNVEKTKVIESLRIKYETEKREKELAISDSELLRTNSILELSNVRNQNLQVSLLLVILLSSIIIFFYQQRQRAIRQLRKKEKAIFYQRVDDLLQEQEIKSLSASLETQERERKRIAEDLHDRLGSMLSSVKLHYDAASSSSDPEKMKKAANILDDTIRETRKIAYDLNSAVLSNFGLIPALQDLKETLESSRKIRVILNVFNVNNRLSSELEVNLYRLVQEAISNALKHSNASIITIQFTKHEDNQLTLIIEDNGDGFEVVHMKKGMGIQNMKARVNKFAGNIVFDSRGGHGTTVIVDIPNF